MENKKLKCALFYHNKLDFNIIPIMGKKRPAIKWKPFQTHRTTEEQIKKWWGNGKDYNMAVITGSTSKVVVLDVDSNNPAKILNSIEGFKKEDLNTWTVKTRRGYHFYFRYDHRKTGIIKTTSLFKKTEDKRIISICDVKGEGGIATLPPSTYRPEGEKTTFTYTWYKKPTKTQIKPVPDWLISYIKNKNSFNFNTSISNSFSSNNNEINGIKDLYKGVPEGARNVSLTRLAGSWFRNGLNLQEVLLAAKWWNQKLPSPLPEEEVNRTVLSIYQKEIQQREKTENLKKELLNIFKTNKLELEEKTFLLLHLLKKANSEELSRISIQSFKNQFVELFEELHGFISTRNEKIN